MSHGLRKILSDWPVNPHDEFKFNCGPIPQYKAKEIYWFICNNKKINKFHFKISLVDIDIDDYFHKWDNDWFDLNSIDMFGYLTDPTRDVNDEDSIVP